MEIYEKFRYFINGKITKAHELICLKVDTYFIAIMCDTPGQSKLPYHHPSPSLNLSARTLKANDFLTQYTPHVSSRECM